MPNARWRKELFFTDRAPRSPSRGSTHAVRAGPLVFVSGQTGRVPGEKRAAGDAAQQTRQVMRNITAILEEVGTSAEHIVKRTVFVKRPEDRELVNRTIDEFFPSPCASSTVQASPLAEGALVEIEVVALMPPE